MAETPSFTRSGTAPLEDITAALPSADSVHVPDEMNSIGEGTPIFRISGDCGGA
jgi:hypothetical protein